MEWLQWALEHTILTHEQMMQTIGLFEQAKAMHKDEITKAMCVAFIDGAKIGGITYESPYEYWEQYYNETFNTKEK